jgi:hypothetical protein
MSILPKLTGVSVLSRLRTFMKLKRSMNLFFNPSNSSKKMIELRLRFPYTNVNVLCGSVLKAVFMIEMTGVIPLPLQMRDIFFVGWI